MRRVSSRSPGNKWPKCLVSDEFRGGKCGKCSFRRAHTRHAARPYRDAEVSAIIAVLNCLLPQYLLRPPPARFTAKLSTAAVIAGAAAFWWVNLLLLVIDLAHMRRYSFTRLRYAPTPLDAREIQGVTESRSWRRASLSWWMPACISRTWA